MSAPSELLRLAFAVVSVVFVVEPTKAAEPVYTDVASCRVQDIGPDEFVRHCKGPSGYAATLHYFDGRAVPGFGKARSGTRDEFDLDTVDIEPIAIGTGEPFGRRIEWVTSGAGPCAAILRLGTDRGDRVLVSALDGTSKRLGMVKSNKEARRLAKKACKEGAAATSHGARASDPSPTTSAPTGRPKVGDVLPICSKCPGPVITEVSGGADPSVVARISRHQAKEHCGAWFPDDTQRQASCLDDVMREYGSQTFTASAACGKLEVVSGGSRYRYDGPGKDEFGDRTPQWLNLATKRRAELSAAGDRGTVSAQFELLCPGVMKHLGF